MPQAPATPRPRLCRGHARSTRQCGACVRWGQQQEVAGPGLEGKALAAAADTSLDCPYVMMLEELMQRVVEACASWPEGQAGELEGGVQLLGGMMKD